MSSTLNRYFSREFVLTFIAVGVFLTVVIISKLFIGLLAKVMDGKLPADVVIPMLGLGALQSAILLTPFALLVTAMLVVGRLYRDSEIYAIKAGGVGTFDLIRCAGWPVLPVVAVLFYLSVFSSAWMSRQIETIENDAKGQVGIHSLTPGRFVESSRGGWVIFIEDRDGDTGTAENVFLYSRQAGRVAIETARTAAQENVPELGGESLVLHRGQRYEGVPGEGNFTLLSFKHHAIRLAGLDRSLDPSDPEFMRVSDLMQSNRPIDHAELQWRLSVPISAVLLVLLAFPMSVSNPRQGRFARLVGVIAIYLVYSNVLILAKTWVAEGVLPAVPGLFVVHASLAALVIFLMYRKRHRL